MDKFEILSKMTIEEKVNWTTGNSMWTMLGLKRLGIDEIVVGDGPHGIRAYKTKPGNQLFDGNLLAPSTMFPSATAMASTFNEDLIHKIGKVIGNECNNYEVDVLLAPGINMKRSPLAGRNFEYYSEDPYLTTRCAVNFVKGVQSTGVGACIKHFALNEQENQRRFINTIVDERTMHEYYLRPFYNTIKEAKPHTIMSSYNKINGDYASESKYLLKDVLRDKWNYDGVVISDWGAAQDKVKSIKNGLNVEMPGPGEFNDEVLVALQEGNLSENELDESILPLLTLREKVLMNKNKGKKADLSFGHNVAYEVSKEGIILLENDGILPLKKNTKIGVIGTFAKSPRINGGGSATLKPFKLENPLEELQKRYEVSYCDGYDEENTTEHLLSEVAKISQLNDVLIYFTGTTENLETEGKEREHMNLPEGHIRVMEEINNYNKKVIVILNNGGALDLSPVNNANALIEAWFLGSANGKALIEIISGEVNPSGRLSETIPLCIENTPHYGTFPAKEDNVNYAGDIINNGYRYYDTHKYPVRYPFGYGLSYSSFEYSSMEISHKSFTENEQIKVSVSVTNTSGRAGHEVVQLYIGHEDSYYPRPTKELKSFKKIYLEPNQVKRVSFIITEDDLSIYSSDFSDFRAETGIYTISIGKNIQDVQFRKKVKFNSIKPFRKNLTLEHPLKNFLLYKEKQFKVIEETYRKFPWYEIEEPALRVLRRVKNQFNLDDKTFDELLDSLLK